MEALMEKLVEMEPLLSSMVNLTNLGEYEDSIRKVLRHMNYHPLQVEQIIRRNRELMEAGQYHGRAVLQAVKEAGDPAGKRTFFWDDELARLFEVESDGTAPQ